MQISNIAFNLQHAKNAEEMDVQGQTQAVIVDDDEEIAQDEQLQV